LDRGHRPRYDLHGSSHAGKWYNKIAIFIRKFGLHLYLEDWGSNIDDKTKKFNVQPILMKL